MLTANQMAWIHLSVGPFSVFIWAESSRAAECDSARRLMTSQHKTAAPRSAQSFTEPRMWRRVSLSFI